MSFFAGHGNQQKLFFYDQSFEFDNTKRFGEFTRWVIFDACLVLNVNKRNYMSESFSSRTIDANRFARINQLFNGVHSILGNYGLGWQGNIKKHWYSSARWRTEDIYEYFSKYFIEEGDAIWDAYTSAVKKFIIIFTIMLLLDILQTYLVMILLSGIFMGSIQTEKYWICRMKNFRKHIISRFI